jgi:hypothetical protein
MSIGRLSSVLKAWACLDWQTSGPMDTQDVLHMPRQLCHYPPPYSPTEQLQPHSKNLCLVPIVLHLQISFSCIQYSSCIFIVLPHIPDTYSLLKLSSLAGFSAHIVQQLFRIFRCPYLSFEPPVKLFSISNANNTIIRASLPRKSLPVLILQRRITRGQSSHCLNWNYHSDIHDD